MVSVLKALTSKEVGPCEFTCNSSLQTLIAGYFVCETDDTYEDDVSSDEEEIGMVMLIV